MDRLLLVLETHYMVNLLVVEDSPIFAEVLVSVLKNTEGLNVVKVFDTAERALQELDDLDIDLALVDISLPGMNGIEFVEKAQQRNAALLYLIVSGTISGLDVHRALEAGARGLLRKDNASKIGEAICRVLDGEIYICSELQGFLT